MATSSAARKGLCLSFAGSGFLGVYHFGVINCLFEHGRRWLNDVDKFAGASAGALVAAIMALGTDRVSVQDAMEFVLDLAGDVHKKRLGAFSPGMNILTPMNEYLQKVVPEDGHRIVSGRLFISVTNAQTRRNELVSEFASREELIQYLLASCCVPGFNQRARAVSIDTKRYFDGGLTTNLPRLDNCLTVCVSPFCGRVEICPRDKKVFGPFIATPGQDLQLSGVNIVRLIQALFPPKREELMTYYDSGYKDTKRFLAFQELFTDGSKHGGESTLTLDDIEIENETEYYRDLEKRRKSELSQKST